MPTNCVAPGCYNNGKIEGITYHAFPKNEELRKKWTDAVNRKDWVPASGSKLCSSHFREEDIDRTSLSCVRIRQGVVPTIFAAHFEDGSLNRQPRKCSYIGCRRTKLRCPWLRFYKFPVDRPEICDVWRKNCGKPVLLKKCPPKVLRLRIVCELHFTKDSFTKTLRPRLRKDAVPTLPAPPLEESQGTSSTLVN